jgi:hypothetical protein
VALLFLDYARFTVQDAPAGLLLCIGITKDELKLCRKGEGEAVLARLKDSGIYPYTDWQRDGTSVGSTGLLSFLPRLFGAGRG